MEEVLASSQESTPAGQNQDIESGPVDPSLVPLLPPQPEGFGIHSLICCGPYCTARGLIAIILVYIFMATWLVADPRVDVQARILNFVVEVFVIYYCRWELMELFRSFCYPQVGDVTA